MDDRGSNARVWPFILRDGKVTDYYNDDDRISPHVDFLTWYDAWLDEEIERFNKVYSGTEEDDSTGPTISIFTTRE